MTEEKTTKDHTHEHRFKIVQPKFRYEDNNLLGFLQCHDCEFEETIEFSVEYVVSLMKVKEDGCPCDDETCDDDEMDYEQEDEAGDELVINHM